MRDALALFDVMLQLQTCSLERDELDKRLAKAETALERSSGMVEELTLQLKSARDGCNAAMQSRDATVKELDACREELASTYQRLEAATTELRDAKVA